MTEEVVLVLVTSLEARAVPPSMRVVPSWGEHPAVQGLVWTSRRFCWPWTELPLKVTAIWMPCPVTRSYLAAVAVTPVMTRLGRFVRAEVTSLPRVVMPAASPDWRAMGTVV